MVWCVIKKKQKQKTNPLPLNGLGELTWVVLSLGLHVLAVILKWLFLKKTLIGRRYIPYFSQENFLLDHLWDERLGHVEWEEWDV